MHIALRDARQGQDGARQYGKKPDEDGNQRNTCVADFRGGARKEKLRVADNLKTCGEATP